MYCTYSCMCNTGTTAVLLIAHTYCGYSPPLEEVIPDACAAKATKAGEGHTVGGRMGSHRARDAMRCTAGKSMRP